MEEEKPNHKKSGMKEDSDNQKWMPPSNKKGGMKE